MQQQYELKVQDTNQQALASKISAVRKGYFTDPFAQEFVKFKGKRDIIMHRGYWARLYLFKHILDQFLAESKDMELQVLSLGCGLDTSYYNERANEKEERRYRYVEIDLQEVAKKKIAKIQKSEKIKTLLTQKGEIHVSEDGSHLTCGPYTVTHCDLSNASEFLKMCQHQKIDFTKPTLFFCQCVISYIDAHKFDQVLTTLTTHFDICFFLDYQMFNPHDRFGEMMVKNFASRGCPLIGIEPYPMMQDQRQRFLKAGFQQVEIHSMIKIYNELLDKKEKQRIEKLEYLDEFEEWNIIMGHYFGMVAGHLKEHAKGNEAYRRLRESVRIKI